MAVADKNEERCCLCTALGSAWALLVRGWRAYGAWWEKLEREANRREQEARERAAAEDEREAAEAKITITHENRFTPQTPQELLAITTFLSCSEMSWRDAEMGVKTIIVTPMSLPLWYPQPRMMISTLHDSDHMKKRVRQAIAAARRDGLL